MFDELFVSVRDGIARLRAQSTIVRESRKVEDVVGTAEVRLANFEDRFDRAFAPLMTLEEVVQALSSGTALDRRSAKFAAAQWPNLPLKALLAYLNRCQEHIPYFRRRIFASFDSWLALSAPERAAFTDVISRFENGSKSRHAELPFASWVDPHTIAAMAQSLERLPRPFGDGVARLGLVERWELAGRVRLALLTTMLRRDGAAPTITRLEALAGQSRVRILPPAREDSGAAKFFAQGAAMDVLGAWLEAASADDGDASRVDEMLLDALGDPLGPPQARHPTAWDELQRRASRAYASFVQRLTRSDIEFFFKSAKGEDSKQRATFWLRFIKQVRRTKSFLSAEDRKRLTRSAQTSDDPAYRAAVKRAGSLVGGATSSSAFVLWFDNVVVVEFAKTGNASYWYSAPKFEKLDIPKFAGTIKGEGALKDLSLGSRRAHTPGRWQADFEELLADFMVRPERPHVERVRERQPTRDGGPERDREAVFSAHPVGARTRLPDPAAFLKGDRSIDEVPRDEVIAVVACPECGAERGYPCMTPRGPRSEPRERLALHRTRRDAANELSARNSRRRCR
jgi:hypothetical protein